MRKFGTVVPAFWRGQTGRQIRGLGQAAQLMAVYLISAPDSNLIGLYYLPLVTLAHETNSTPEETRLILSALAEIQWAYYDLDTETVWVRNMAFYQVGETVKLNDNKWPAIVEALVAYDKSPWFMPFLEVYGEPFNLNGAFKGTTNNIPGQFEALYKGLDRVRRKQNQAPSKGLPRASQGGCNPSLAEVESPFQDRNKEQGTGARNKEQEQGTVGAAPTPTPRELPACQLPEFIERDLKAFGVVKAAAKHDLIQALGRQGLRCAIVKLKTKAGAKNLAGLLVTRGKELAQEGETILREASMKALAGAPEALKDPRWVKLPAELQDDLEVQVAWAVWIRTESHMRACPGDDEAPRAEKAARRPLLAILAERHPDQAGFKARLEATMSAMSAGGLTPQALKLAAMTAALGL